MAIEGTSRPHAGDARSLTGRPLVVLFLAALALRPELVGVGPLASSIQESLGLSHTVTGLLATIPVVCMGVFAPAASVVYRHLGARRGVVVGVLAIGVFGLARALAADPLWLLTETLGIGAGIGIAGALLPIAVKELTPSRPLGGTLAYSLGIQSGSALAAALAIPIAGLFGGWRSALAAFSLVAVGLAMAWFEGSRGSPERGSRLTARLAWRSPTAWRLATAFALFGAVYYGLVAWLPDSYAERGWTPVAAGALLASLNAASLAGTLVIPLLRRALPRRDHLLVGLSSAFAAAVLGLALWPAAATVWAVVAGAANGAMFPLVLAMPLDEADTPGGVAAVSGVMLSVGYTLAAVAPVLLGLVRDVTSSFTPGLLILGGLALALTALLVAPMRRGVARGMAG